MVDSTDFLLDGEGGLRPATFGQSCPLLKVTLLGEMGSTPDQLDTLPAFRSRLGPFLGDSALMHLHYGRRIWATFPTILTLYPRFKPPGILILRI